ncbi:MAG: hypothetical protein CMG75_00820 [Candidatus Marinimicrobia bacterium]|nr:hypothetical protein [Candidatus Neomarinimicrobiota bacterium]|tara:strand:+ start:13537 stop:14529 length:993 start_codon:yes stop_codon:yes gene_type:complete
MSLNKKNEGKSMNPNSIKFIILSTILILFITGCENPFSSNELVLDSIELEQFSNDLEIELGLSLKNSKSLKKALGKHGNKGLWDKDPGFLWKLAAELHEKLSDEGKEKIFARLSKIKDNPKGRIGQGPKNGFKGKKDHFSILQKILTENQKEEFAIIMEKHRLETSAIHEGIKAGEITRQEGEKLIKNLDNLLKESIDSILTENQKVQLDEIKQEIEAKKEAFEEQIRLAKIEALGLTNDQIIALDIAEEKAKNALDSLKTLVESAELSREDGKVNVEIILKRKKNAHLNILSEKQIEIIKIHQFLHIRWHLKNKNSKDRFNEEKGDREG